MIVLFLLFAGIARGVGTTAEDYLVLVSPMDWARAEASPLLINFTEYAYQPDNVTFAALQPYVLRIETTPSTMERHYIAAEEFFTAVATRLVRTRDGEYFSPYFTALELHHADEGGVGWLEFHFLPVVPGSYAFFCTKDGHADLGETGTIHITGEERALDVAVPEVSATPAWDATLATDPRAHKSHPVWSAQVSHALLVENQGRLANTAVVPATLTLTKGVAQRIVISKASGTTQVHEFAAPDLFRTSVWRKCKDQAAEIKFNVLRSVVLRTESAAQLFFVPTVAGDFPFSFTIDGQPHLTASGTIRVVDDSEDACTAPPGANDAPARAHACSLLLFVATLCAVCLL